MFKSSRRLFWSELGPHDVVCMLLEIDFAGQTFRWSTSPITMLNVDSELIRFDGGLNELDFGAVLQTLADTPDQASISVDLLWPVDVALLISQGHDLSAATGELSAWVEGKTYEDRQILVRGRVRQPDYGGFNDVVSFTLEEAPFQDVGEWPTTSERVDETTWPTFQESESGRPYVQVIGRPGVFRRADGAGRYDVGTRAMVVETDPTDNTLASTLMVAGHKIKSATVNIYYVGAEGATPDEGYIDFGGAGSVDLNGPVEYVQDSIGQWVSVVRIDTAVVDEIRRAQEFQVRWAQVIPDNTKGGLVWYDEAEAIRGAGDVMRYVLMRSTLRIDWGRFEAVRARMNAWSLDGYLTEVVQPWEWITDNILPLMPVSMHSGADGIYPVFWNWDAGTHDAVDHIEWSPGIDRVSNVEYERAPSEICNRLTLKYAWGVAEKEHQRSVIHTPNPTRVLGLLVDPEQVTSEFSKRSALRFGMTAQKEMTSNVVIDDATAHRSVNWRILAEGFSQRSVQYTVPQRYAYLELGDVVTLTDSEIHLDNIVALVQGMDVRDTGRILITLQLVENVARAPKTTGPHPDQGAPDPGDYQ